MSKTSIPGLFYLLGAFSLHNPVATNQTKNNCNNCDHQKNVNDVTHSKAGKAKIADQPKNDQNDSYCIKKISHCLNFLSLSYL